MNGQQRYHHRKKWEELLRSSTPPSGGELPQQQKQSSHRRSRSPTPKTRTTRPLAKGTVARTQETRPPPSPYTSSSSRRSRSPYSPNRGPKLRTAARSTSRQEKRRDSEAADYAQRPNTRIPGRQHKETMDAEQETAETKQLSGSSGRSQELTPSSKTNLRQWGFDVGAKSGAPENHETDSELSEEIQSAKLPPAGCFSYGSNSSAFQNNSISPALQQDTSEWGQLISSLQRDITDSKGHIHHWGQLLRQKLHKLILGRSKEERLKSQIDLENRRTRQLMQTLNRTLEHAEVHRDKPADENANSLFERACERARKLVEKAKDSGKELPTSSENSERINEAVAEVQRCLEELSAIERETYSFRNVLGHEITRKMDTVDDSLVNGLSNPTGFVDESSVESTQQHSRSNKPPPLEIPETSDNGKSSTNSNQVHNHERDHPVNQDQPAAKNMEKVERTNENYAQHSSSGQVSNAMFAVKSPTKRREAHATAHPRYSLYQHTASSLRRISGNEVAQHRIRKKSPSGKRSVSSSPTRSKNRSRTSSQSSRRSLSPRSDTVRRPPSPSSFVHPEAVSRHRIGAWGNLGEMKVADVLRSPRAAGMLLKTLNVLAKKYSSESVSSDLSASDREQNNQEEFPSAPPGYKEEMQANDSRANRKGAHNPELSTSQSHSYTASTESTKTNEGVSYPYHVKGKNVFIDTEGARVNSAANDDHPPQNGGNVNRTYYGGSITNNEHSRQHGCEPYRKPWSWEEVIEERTSHSTNKIDSILDSLQKILE